jgi:mono/diheme cytochrome c family protein
MGTIAVAKAEGDEGQAGPPSTFDGSGLYRNYCASCHGEKGRGDGPVAAHLKPIPADLTQIAKRNVGKFPADRVSQLIDGRQIVKPHGTSQMPVWGDAFSKTTTDTDEASIKAKIAALVNYLATIQEPPAR